MRVNFLQISGNEFLQRVLLSSVRQRKTDHTRCGRDSTAVHVRRQAVRRPDTPADRGYADAIR